MREHRVAKKLNQSVVAERMGLANKGEVSKLENGKVKVTETHIFGFATALGINPEALFRPPGEQTIDDMVREAPPELRAHILGIVAALARS